MAQKKGKKKQQNKSGKSRGGAWFIVFLVALCGVAGYVYLKPSKIAVPSLVGKTQQEAEEVLGKLRLRSEVRLETPQGEDAKPGEVLKQAPAAGVELPTGSVVTLFVSDSPDGIPLPDVSGKTRSEAEDLLRRLGFEVTFKDAKSDSVKIGRVISQEPAAEARLARGGTVVLTVSAGKGEQSIRSLVGLSPEAAEKQLKKLGLEMTVLQVVESGFRTGDPVRVLRQEPEAGQKLKPGSRVTVFIPIPAPAPPADGSQSHAAHAPRLEGLTVAQARKVAGEKGVALEFAESADDAAVITFQDPPPGDPLNADAAVLVRTAISSVVPGVTGISEAEARARVEKAQLVVGSVKKSYGPVKGEVLGQRPVAGIEVTAGSPVDLVIGDPSMSPDAAKNTAPAPTPAFTPAPWVD